MIGLSGVTDIKDSKEVTARVRFPKTVPKEAVIVAVPAVTAVARPLLLTVATDGFDDPQVTCGVIS
jgi:hypothetical protein